MNISINDLLLYLAIGIVPFCIILYFIITSAISASMRRYQQTQIKLLAAIAQTQGADVSVVKAIVNDIGVQLPADEFKAALK